MKNKCLTVFAAVMFMFCMAGRGNAVTLTFADPDFEWYHATYTDWDGATPYHIWYAGDYWAQTFNSTGLDSATHLLFNFVFYTLELVPGVPVYLDVLVNDIVVGGITIYSSGYPVAFTTLNGGFLFDPIEGPSFSLKLIVRSDIDPPYSGSPSLVIEDGASYAVLTSSPVSEIFTDVPLDFWALSYIESIYKLGITKGCGNGFFCPKELINRAQAAVFIERAINGGSYSPSPAIGIFADVPTTFWAADWIEQFYEDGLTKGCNTNPLQFCPDQNVTRADMAIFLLRKKHGSSYSPPKAAGVFADVSKNHWAADWIEQLYAEGITTGCSGNPLRFCPDDSVTRAEMAAFLVKTFNLE
ncbi:MAG: S-layer homology domain-containing protein [Desulfoferrobacter sp.]